MNTEPELKPIVTAGAFLGVGLGGFFDGIVFHQLLQFHAMLSAKLPKTSVANVEINMFWDGVFHSFTFAMTLAGVILLWKAGARARAAWSGRALAGAMFAGWGLFNVVEGVINHHFLHLHHVVESRGESVFDYLFLASGVLFLAGGILAIRSAGRSPVQVAGGAPRGR